MLVLKFLPLQERLNIVCVRAESKPWKSRAEVHAALRKDMSNIGGSKTVFGTYIAILTRYEFMQYTHRRTTE